jgi:excisionase family DNA binding protein
MQATLDCNQPKMFLTVLEAAQICSVGKTKMHELTHIEGFPAIRVGKRVLVIASKLEAWMIANSDRL